MLFWFVLGFGELVGGGCWIDEVVLGGAMRLPCWEFGQTS